MKQLLILSGKGGTGKTTIAGAFIRLAGAKAYADCDIDAPNLHLIMPQNSNPKKTDYYGMPKAHIDVKKCIQCGQCSKACQFDAIDHTVDYQVDIYACEGCGVCEAVCTEAAVSLKPAVSGELKLYTEGDVFSTARLKMGSGNSGLLVASVKKQLRESVNADGLAILDGSPGIGCPVIASLSGVNLVLIVTEPSLSGISDMERVCRMAGQLQTRVAICINKYDTNMEMTKKIEEYCRERVIPFVGRIPFDKEVITAVNNGKSVVETECKAGKAIMDVFEKTINILYKQGD